VKEERDKKRNERRMGCRSLVVTLSLTSVALLYSP